jgi:positive regulator of sigma E activity
MVSTQAFVNTLLIDIGIFLLMLVIYLIFRPYRNRKVKDEENEVRMPIFSEYEDSLYELHSKVWNTPLKEIPKYCGLEGKNYLILHKQISILLCIMVCIDIPILIPIYTTGEESEDDMERMGIANIILTSDLLIAPIVFIFLNSILSYILIYAYLKEANQRGIEVFCTQRELLTIEKYTIEVFGIPKQYKAKDINEEFKRVFQGEFKDIYIEGYVVPDYTDAYIDKIKIEKIQERLDYYNNYLEM